MRNDHWEEEERYLQAVVVGRKILPSTPISFGALVVKEPVFLSTLLMTAIIKFRNLGELRFLNSNECFLGFSSSDMSVSDQANTLKYVILMTNAVNQISKKTNSKRIFTLMHLELNMEKSDV